VALYRHSGGNTVSERPPDPTVANDPGGTYCPNAPSGSMILKVDATRAFVSYARSDEEFVLRLCKDLRSSGAAIWLDTLDIQAGEKWDQEIARGLSECGRMLVVLSPRSVASQNVLDEVGYALSQKRQIIPALIRDCEVPYRLSRIQYIDFRADYDKGLRDTLLALGSPPGAPAQPDRRVLVRVGIAAAAAAAGALAWVFFRSENPDSFVESFRGVLVRYVEGAPQGFRDLGARKFEDWKPSVALPGAKSCRGFGYPDEPVIECIVHRTNSELEATRKFEELIALSQTALPGWKGARLNLFNAFLTSPDDATVVGLGVSKDADGYDVELSVRPRSKK